MKVTIGDLDYYNSQNKINCFNIDAMKISSFHKQSGDTINFIMKEDDINRPADLIYIIKESSQRYNPPFQFFYDSRVRWGGAGYQQRINWKMPIAMMACRPDYLLYPEKNTVLERAEQIRFLDDQGHLLPIKQNGRNSFKNKRVIVTDKNLWTTSRENLKQVLIELQNILNVTFFEPIWIQKFKSDEELIQLFLKINIQQGSNINGIPIMMHDYYDCAAIVERIKERWPYIKFGPIHIKLYTPEHWQSHDAAAQDGNALKDIIVHAKKHQIMVEVKQLTSRMDTPYFLLFETVSNGTKKNFKGSGLEWLTVEFGPGLKFGRNMEYWAHSNKWNEVFRDLIRQTYTEHDFLVAQGGEKSISDNDIPGQLGKEIFRYGI